MDFEKAALRLEREQSTLRGRNRSNHVSIKAKREADFRKRQQQLLKEQREREQSKINFLKKRWRNCERSLGVQELASGGLYLKATSIHGDGDKIALPPSVLERLTQSLESHLESSPWTFRVGILNPSYSFPASLAMQNARTNFEDDMEEESDDDDNFNKRERKEYLDELSHKYIAYAHASVVEFTQEEGHVGLPQSIAETLLSPEPLHRNFNVPSMRTVDPSRPGEMNVINEDKTSGHLAWGSFDIPDVPLEISLVKLPKGSGCTLVPTVDAIRNGFHQLRDIKLVLEQSLGRTRATLSVGDVVHTWHRGTRFDLKVTSVTPDDWNSISIVNTDVEVNIGANTEMEQLLDRSAPTSSSSTPHGYSLLHSTESMMTKPKTLKLDGTPGEREANVASLGLTPDLLPEPPTEQVEFVCTVQIRADRGSGRRRFDINIATVRDLFVFAATFTNLDSFQLVTRFPRKVLTVVEDTNLQAAGIEPGQHLFLVEQI